MASGAALTLGAALASGQLAQAATFNVTNLNDAGAGSLRQAIADANGAAGADVVTFQPGLTGTITLTTGQLDVTDSVDVQGPGAAVLTVSGNDSSRVFYLYSSSAVLDVTLSGLTVTGGNAAFGAGISAFGENLVLDGVTLTGNEASGVGGGLGFSDAEIAAGATLTIRDSVISGNSAFLGGGIYVEYATGPVLIQNTLISDNQAYGGGGIVLYGVGADTTIEGSTISGNQAGVGGGMAFVYGYEGTHTIRGTTISGNTAVGFGGGLFADDPGTFVLENSTLSGNQAILGSGGGASFYGYETEITLRHVTVAGNSAGPSGGGIFADVASPVLVNTIVANNTASSDNDLANGSEGSFDVSFSLIESPGTATLNDNGGNVFNQDPQLGPLQNNGGPTQTHLPVLASPAVNAGTNADSLPTDQRGAARPFNATVDMGAVEVSPGIPIPAIPTLGGSGKLLFSALCALGGFLLLRRRKGLAAPMLAVSLTLGTAAGVQAAEQHREVRAAALAQIESHGGTVVIRLADGTSYEVSQQHFRLIERRKGRRGQAPPGLAALPASQPVLLKVRHGRGGEVKRVRVVLMDTAAKAQAAVRNKAP